MTGQNKWYRRGWFRRGQAVVLVLGLVSVVLGLGALQTPAPAAAAAERRVALVIGNGAYRHAPHLANPPVDAKAMAAALGKIGFEVVSGTDLGREETIQLLKSFRQKVVGADIALVFYAGHGIEVAGRKFLLPVDVKLADEKDLDDEAVAVERVLAELEPTRRLRVVVLDACRDNPFAQQVARSMGTRSLQVTRGFSRIDVADTNTLIAYSTKENTVAADGNGEHSPYAAALLNHITTPGLSIERLFGKVRDDVMAATEGKQQPFTYGSLGGDPIYLAGAGAAAGPVLASAEATPAVAGGDSVRSLAAGATIDDAAELAFWDSIKDSTRPADYAAYLETYPKGRFAALARVRAATGAAAPAQVAAVAPASGQAAPVSRTANAPTAPTAAATASAAASAAGPTVPAAPPIAAPITVVSPPGAATSGPSRRHKGLFGLVVGINDYESGPKLEGPVDDARDVANALARAGARDVRLITDRAASRNAILTAFRELVAEAAPGDTIVFSFSGLGDQRPEYVRGSEADGMDEFLVLAGYTLSGPGANELILDDDLDRLFQQAPGVTKLFVADTGHSGTLVDNVDDSGNVVYFGAAPDNEMPPSIRVDGHPRGALSWAFARAIEGAADANGDDIISKGELERAIQEAINSRTRGLQHPVIRPAGQANLPLIQLQHGGVSAGK